MCGQNHQKMQSSEGSQAKWSEMKWRVGYIGVVKWNEAKVILKCVCDSSWQYAFQYWCTVTLIFVFIIFY
jgi:hypothetical protein